MVLRYQPDEKAVQLAEKTMNMKISVQGVLDAVSDEKEKYRHRMNVVLDSAEETILHYSEDDRITDEKLGWAQRNKEVLGDSEKILEEIYGSEERGLESMRDIIDGRVLSTLKVSTILKDQDMKENREAALTKMIDVAVWQAMELLGFDLYTDAGLVPQAKDIIRDRLGIDNKSFPIRRSP